MNNIFVTLRCEQMRKIPVVDIGVKEALHGCTLLFDKHCFYVNSDGCLDGYSWYNIPMRLLLAIQNWWSGNRYEKEAADRFTNLFWYVLALDKESDHFSLQALEGKGHFDHEVSTADQFYKTHFYSRTTSTPISYERLAKEAFKVCDMSDYPKLMDVVSRLFKDDVSYAFWGKPLE